MRCPLGDFCQKSYQLARLFARLLCCAKGYIARLCAPLRALQADENPAQSGNFFRQFALVVTQAACRDETCAPEGLVPYALNPFDRAGSRGDRPRRIVEQEHGASHYARAYADLLEHLCARQGRGA
jgi:hypothetical protein